jgi:hypothetical protein
MDTITTTTTTTGTGTGTTRAEADAVDLPSMTADAFVAWADEQPETEL